MIKALKGGAALAMGVDHDNLDVSVTVPDARARTRLSGGTWREQRVL
jgi:hypothetical protein